MPLALTIYATQSSPASCLNANIILENKRLAEYLATVVDNDPTKGQIENFRAEAFALYQKMLMEIGDRFEIQFLE